MTVDKAKEKCSEDILGLNKLYESIAQYVKEYSEDGSLTISIEGDWGSGKSTLSNFIIEKIEDKTDKIEIMHFNPWVITDIKNLVEYFFSELYSKVILHESVDAKVEEFKKEITKLVSLITSNNNIEEFLGNKSLNKTRDNIKEIMTKLDKKILIVIDDIDRLTDQETEVLFRLIKGIADFDNLIYILLFDKKLVAKSLRKYKDEDGEKYLDKIVNYSISVPKIIEKTLSEELLKSLEEINSIDRANIKWIYFMDSFSKYITNLRDIKRLIGSLKIEYNLVKDSVDFLDFIIITLIKIKNIEFYNFIQRNQYFFMFTHFNDKEISYDNMINKFNDTGYGEYISLIKIIFPVFNSNGESLRKIDIKNNFICVSSSFDFYFSISNEADFIKSKEFINALKVLNNKHGNIFRKSLGFFRNDIYDFLKQLNKVLLDESYIKSNSSNQSNIVSCLVISSILMEDESYYSPLIQEKIHTLSVKLFEKLSEEQFIKVFNIEGEHAITNMDEIYVMIKLLKYIRLDMSIKNTKNVKGIIIKKINKSLLAYDWYNERRKSIQIDRKIIEILNYSGNYNIEIKKLRRILNRNMFDSKEEFFNVLKSFTFNKISDNRFKMTMSKEHLFQLVSFSEVSAYISNLTLNDLTPEYCQLLDLYAEE